MSEPKRGPAQIAKAARLIIEGMRGRPLDEEIVDVMTDAIWDAFVAGREAASRGEKLQGETDRRIAAAVVARFEEEEPSPSFWRIVADVLLVGFGGQRALERRFGEGSGPKVMKAAVEGMSAAELRGFALELALEDALYAGAWVRDGDARKRLLAWAKVDAKALEREARAELKARESAAKKGSAEPKAITALVGTREEAIARHAGKELEPLAWEKEGENQVAAAGTLGTYCVEPMASGRAAVFFTEVGGRSKRIGEAATEGKAKDLALRDWLERAGDTLLKNAGAGELTKKDTKGEAVARKPRRGGRRG